MVAGRHLAVSGVAADPTMALYNATKAFVHGLTRSIAVDHGPGVRCNAVLPGWTDRGFPAAPGAVLIGPMALPTDQPRPG